MGRLENRQDRAVNDGCDVRMGKGDQMTATGQRRGVVAANLSTGWSTACIECVPPSRYNQPVQSIGFGFNIHYATLDNTTTARFVHEVFFIGFTFFYLTFHASCLVRSALSIQPACQSIGFGFGRHLIRDLRHY